VPLLCLMCGDEFEVDSAPACPGCGDATHIPADLSDMVNLRISAHELRILMFWADNWARAHDSQDSMMRKVIQVILDRLSVQTEAALSLSQELADISRLPGVGSVKLIDSEGNEKPLLY
jgi:hypothetical protein